ncbi:MAG TPA: glycosyltransferase family 4 protein [Pilimelia sp.]|nr:glycosyltransferase family 4 protein [Pilimelia sp.]
MSSADGGARRTGDGFDAGAGRPWWWGLRVLRLCSVFEAPAGVLDARAARFDAVGGMQTHTGELTRALDGLGVRQTVVTTRQPGLPPVVRAYDRAVVVRLGLPVAVCRQFYAVPAARLVPRLAARADLIHAHLGEDLAVVPIALTAARQRRIPLVLTVHTSVRYTLAVTGFRSAMLRTVGGWWERRGERRADQVVALTHRLAQILTGHGVPADRVRVIPSGVRRELFASAEAPDPLAGLPSPRVVFLGRLHPQKNVDVVVGAMALVRDPGAHLVIAGDGPHRDRLVRLCGRLGLRERVTFLGFVDHDRVPALLRGADVLVMPSRYEELGTAVVEAMHCGVPVVAARTGGMPGLVGDGEAGLLVDPGDVAGFAAAIDRLLADPAARRRMGEQGRRRAAGHGWDRLVGQILDVYGAALGSRPAIGERGGR